MLFNVEWGEGGKMCEKAKNNATRSINSPRRVKAPFLEQSVRFENRMDLFRSSISLSSYSGGGRVDGWEGGVLSVRMIYYPVQETAGTSFSSSSPLI